MGKRDLVEDLHIYFVRRMSDDVKLQPETNENIQYYMKGVRKRDIMSSSNMSKHISTMVADTQAS